MCREKERRLRGRQNTLNTNGQREYYTETARSKNCVMDARKRKSKLTERKTGNNHEVRKGCANSMEEENTTKKTS